MKAIFESEDAQEIKRIAMADQMAIFIWELVHNGWRDFKHTDYDYHPSWDKIHKLLDEHGINIEDLTD